MDGQTRPRGARSHVPKVHCLRSVACQPMRLRRRVVFLVAPCLAAISVGAFRSPRRSAAAGGAPPRAPRRPGRSLWPLLLTWGGAGFSEAGLQEAAMLEEPGEETLFRELDTDGDGAVDRGEYLIRARATFDKRDLSDPRIRSGVWSSSCAPCMTPATSMETAS